MNEVLMFGGWIISVSLLSWFIGFVMGAEKVMRQIRKNAMEDLLDKNRSNQ